MILEVESPVDFGPMGGIGELRFAALRVVLWCGGGNPRIFALRRKSWNTPLHGAYFVT